jgi:hypothetical protein
VGRTRLDSGDESWNPRARVGPVVPKKDRPTRDGAKRPAVERVLEAAAQRRALEPVYYMSTIMLKQILMKDYLSIDSQKSLYSSKQITIKYKW